MQLPEVHQSVRGTTIQLPDRGLENWVRVRVRELIRMNLVVLVYVVDLNPQYVAHLVSI